MVALQHSVSTRWDFTGNCVVVIISASSVREQHVLLEVSPSLLHADIVTRSWQFIISPRRKQQDKHIWQNLNQNNRLLTASFPTKNNYSPNISSANQRRLNGKHCNFIFFVCRVVYCCVMRGILVQIKVSTATFVMFCKLKTSVLWRTVLLLILSDSRLYCLIGWESVIDVFLWKASKPPSKKHINHNGNRGLTWLFTSWGGGSYYTQVYWYWLLLIYQAGLMAIIILSCIPLLSVDIANAQTAGEVANWSSLHPASVPLAVQRNTPWHLKSINQDHLHN